MNSIAEERQDTILRDLLRTVAEQNALLRAIAAEVFVDPNDGGQSRLSPGIEKRLKEFLEK